MSEKDLWKLIREREAILDERHEDIYSVAANADKLRTNARAMQAELDRQLKFIGERSDS